MGGASGSRGRVAAFSFIKLWPEDSANTWHSCSLLSNVTPGPLQLEGTLASSDVSEAGCLLLANLDKIVETEKGGSD